MNFPKIISGLLLVSTTIFGAMTDQEKAKLVCVQMMSIDAVLTMFKFDNKTYPTTDEGLNALVKNPDENKYPHYFQNGYFHDGKVPKDIWQNNFNYKLSENAVNLFSSGSDGIAGTNDDVHFSECKSQ